jgi:hypothetical protein
VLRKQMQDLLLDVAMLSDTHLKFHERFFIPNYHFYQTDCYPGRNGITVVAVRKGIPRQPCKPTPPPCFIRNSRSAYLLAVAKY